MKQIPLCLAAAGALCFGISRLRRPSLAGQVVLITGGSRGLGLEMGRLLAADGTRLALTARDEETLKRAGAELASKGAEVLIMPTDLRDRAEAARAVEATVQRFGRIDLLINCAGIMVVGPWEHLQPSDYEEALGLHLWAPLITMQTAVPHMRRQGGGRIVNISSIGGLVAIPHMAAYVASKFALTGLSETFRAELAAEGISVTTVCPGLMRTGSHINALFRSQHAKEFAWFSAGASTPFTSINSSRAARQILDAAARKRPRLVITWQARTLALGASLLPGIAARAQSLTARLLPSPADDPGPAVPGWQCEGAFRKSTNLPDQASRRNNELPDR